MRSMVFCGYETIYMLPVQCQVIISMTNVVFVLGGPGSGKSTICARIEKHFKGWKHICVSDLLRAAANEPGNKYSRTIQYHFANGSIIPSAITIQLILREMDKFPCVTFLLDGFPRNLDNLQKWDTRLCVLFSLYFECDDGTLLQRMRVRNRCGEDEALIQQRLRTFHIHTMPVVNSMFVQSNCKTISAARSEDEVWDSVVGVFMTSL